MTIKQQYFASTLLTISTAIIMILLSVTAYFAKDVVDQVKTTNQNVIKLNEAIIINTQAINNKTIIDNMQNEEIEVLKIDVKDHEGRLIKIEAKR